MTKHKKVSGFSGKSIGRILETMPAYDFVEHGVSISNIDVRCDGAGGSTVITTLKVDGVDISFDIKTASTELLECWENWKKRYDIKDVKNFDTEEQFLDTLCPPAMVSETVEAYLLQGHPDDYYNQTMRQFGHLFKKVE